MQIIYITGRGGDANKGLGEHLKSLNANRIGLSVNSQFLKLDFRAQIEFAGKLISDFDSPETYIIANSYGAYLCLQALIDAPRYQSHFLLLSPVIGAALNPQTMAYSRLPSCQRYELAVSEKRLTKPSSLAIHIGSEDIGYSPQPFSQLCSSLGGCELDVIENQGHTLDRIRVQGIVHKFLSREVQ
jgi:hypothetical protein